jgi:hypothetical protein
MSCLTHLVVDELLLVAEVVPLSDSAEDERSVYERSEK